MKKVQAKKNIAPLKKQAGKEKSTSANKEKCKVFPASTFDVEPVCFCQGIHENDCLNCVFIGRCLYTKVEEEIKDFKENKPEEYAAARTRLKDLTYLYKEISSAKM